MTETKSQLTLSAEWSHTSELPPLKDLSSIDYIPAVFVRKQTLPWCVGGLCASGSRRITTKGLRDFTPAFLVRSSTGE